MDDILTTSDHRGKLYRLAKRLHKYLNEAEWYTSDKKSVLIRQKEIKFLGDDWKKDRLKEPAEAAVQLQNIRYFLKRPNMLNLKLRQRVAGYFSYYASFAGKRSTFSHNKIQQMQCQDKDGQTNC